MKTFLYGAIIALLGPSALLFCPVRQQLNPVLIRTTKERSKDLTR